MWRGVYQERHPQEDAAAHRQPQGAAAPGPHRVPAGGEQVLLIGAPDTAGQLEDPLLKHGHFTLQNPFMLMRTDKFIRNCFDCLEFKAMAHHPTQLNC